MNQLLINQINKIPNKNKNDNQVIGFHANGSRQSDTSISTMDLYSNTDRSTHSMLTMTSSRQGTTMHLWE